MEKKMKSRLICALTVLIFLSACQSSPKGSSSTTATSTPDSPPTTEPQVKQAQSAEYSGFLPPNMYTKLQSMPDREGVMSYVDRSRDYRGYTKVLIEPVAVYLIPNPDYKGMPRDALLRMTTDFQNAFRNELSKGYTVVTKPGLDVLRVRTAITGVQPAPPPLGVTDFIPIKALFNLGRKAVGAAPKIAEMSAELELLAPDGSVVGAAIATRKGDERLPQGEQITWNEMHAISEYWAKSLRQRLDELRGVTSAQ
jgi:hypothetical protein